jgi:hypothetical protein
MHPQKKQEKREWGMEGEKDRGGGREGRREGEVERERERERGGERKQDMEIPTRNQMFKYMIRRKTRFYFQQSSVFFQNFC